MAKSTKKAGGKKAKKTLKMPKTIAGIKVPKEVRKAAEPILAAARNPVVAEIAAAALVAAAGAIATRRKKPELNHAIGAARAKVAATGDSLRSTFNTLASDMADRALSALEGLERNLADATGSAKMPEAPEPPETPSAPRRTRPASTH